MDDVKWVLQDVRDQGTMGAMVEDAKGTILLSISLEDLFNELDRTRKGCSTDAGPAVVRQRRGWPNDTEQRSDGCVRDTTPLGPRKRPRSSHSSVHELGLLVCPPCSLRAAPRLAPSG